MNLHIMSEEVNLNVKVEKPIDWLKDFITGRMEHTNSAFYKLCEDLVSEGRIQAGIAYNVGKDFKRPAGILPNGQIYIESTFLCMAWAIIYNANVVFMEQSGEIEFTNEEKELINDFSSWGMSLMGGYDNWEDRYPKPQEHENDKIVVMTNNLFLYAINYVLCHEIGHIVLDHFKGTQSPIDKEYEADMWSFEQMMKGENGKNDNYIENGILSGLGCMLFLSPYTEDSIDHPASLKRMERYLDKYFSSEDNHPVWAMACGWLSLWNAKFNKGLDFSAEHSSAKGWFYGIYSQVYP